VIDLMPDQKKYRHQGPYHAAGKLSLQTGARHAGAQSLSTGYGDDSGTTPSRFEYNNDFRQSLQEKGLVLSGLSRMNGWWRFVK